MSRLVRIATALVVAGGVLASSLEVAPRARAAEELAYGVIVDTTDARSMRMAREAGFTHAKMVLHWAHVEPSAGHFLWNDTRENDFDNILKAARNEEMLLVVRVDGVPGWAGGSPANANLKAVRNFYENAARYAAGTVVGYEILNEPNLDREWGGAPNAGAYTAFMKAASRGIKEGDPNALVIGGGPAPGTGNNPGATIEDFDFINGMYDAGARGFMDALAVHSYGGNTEPEADPSSCGICFRRTERYREIMLRHGDEGTPIWLTEWGYLMDSGSNLGQYDWMKVSAKKQADFIVRAHRFAAENWPWLTGSLLFNIDGATSPYQNYGPHDAKAWFSLVNADYSPRPAYRAFKEFRARQLEAAAAERAAAAAAQAAQVESVPQPDGGAPGERVRVAGTDGGGLSLRARPGLASPRLTTLPEGTLLTTVGAPTQVDGLSWRYVRDGRGIAGWVAERYIQVVA